MFLTVLCNIIDEITSPIDDPRVSCPMASVSTVGALLEYVIKHIQIF